MLLNNKKGVSRLGEVNNFLRTHAQVESQKELASMFQIYRAYGEDNISPNIAMNYLDYAGCLDVDTKNPLVLLTYYVPKFDVYLSICNKYEQEDSVLAICFNSVGKKILFPYASNQGIFSVLNFRLLSEAIDLEDMPQMSGISSKSVEKILYTQHLNAARLEYEAKK